MLKYCRGISLLLWSLFIMVLACGQACARELRLGIGFALPPYVIRQENRGVEVDIIRESLANVGHSVTFAYLPNLRMPVEFSQGTVDGIVANVVYDIETDSNRRGFATRPTIAYQNSAISMERCGCGVSSIAELKGKKVLAFNNATKYLGREFAAMAVKNPNYSELADQSLQVRMLYSGRVQVVVSDRRIFQWWRKRLMEDEMGESMDFTALVVFDDVFPPAWRHVTFARQDDRDDFDRGFEMLKQSGRFDAIVRQYAGPAEGEEVRP